MSREDAVRLAAYDTIRHGRARSADDERFGSTHSRRNRSFVLVPHGNKVVRFLPPKFWQQTSGVSQVTIRAWIRKGYISTFTMYGMHVMCKAELLVIRDVTSRWWGRQSVHSDTNPAFKKDLQDALRSVRAALDSFKAGHPLDAVSKGLITTSLEEPLR